MLLMKIGELVLNDTDFASYKTEYQKIDGEGTKRNLRGTMRRQVVANKVKLVTKISDMVTEEKMSEILKKAKQDTLKIDTFYDTETRKYRTMNCYCGTPAPEIDQILNDKIYYKAMTLDFIEL